LFFDVLTLIDFIIQDTRSLVSEIGSPILYELGFEPAVEWLVRQTMQKHGLNVHFQKSSHSKPLHEDVINRLEIVWTVRSPSPCPLPQVWGRGSG